MKKALRIIFALSLVFVMAFAFAACGDESDSTNKDTTLTENDTANSDVVKAEIEIVNYGTIKLDLFADEAPITVSNFVSLAKKGFYDGLTFHRIIKGFMMQGGDPLGNGTGGNTDENGKEVNIVGEFSANGHENNISHIRGTISMARNGMSMDSASSQFFIMHKDSFNLDGQYAAFGRVTEGMDVVDKVCESVSPIDNNGTIPASEQPVIKTIKIIG